MNILDWIKKILKVKSVKQIEEPKETEKENSWKQSIQYSPDTEKKQDTLTEEQIRIEQIMHTQFMILFKDGYLLKEDIIKAIKQQYDEVILTDADMESLISIHDVMKYEDLHGDYNIREFLDEDENENNFVKLVDKLIEHAKQEAQKYEMEDISQFVTNDSKIMNELKNDIIKENKIEKDDDEIENEQ